MTGIAPESISWPELVSAALVGTARRPLTLSVPALETESTPPTPAASLLDLATLATARRRAGRLPDPTEPGVDDEGSVSPADRLPEVPAEMVSTLSVLLAGQVHVPGGPTALVQEWLERCASARRRLPHRYLPTVLTLAQTRPELRPAVAAIADMRGRWLARQVEAWPWVERLGAEEVTDAAVEVWRTGTPAERAELLRVVRTRQPDRARALVDETWATDGAAERASHLEAVAINLSMSDEPLLESALDDRSKQVRAVAVRLLDRLPESRRAIRMTARTLRLVHRSGLVRSTVEMRRPGEPDTAARRDGITDTPVEPMGKTAWWALQMVAGTPLSVWETHLGAAPDKLLELAAGTGHLVAGWRRAALAQADPDWVAAIFRRQPRPELLATMGAVAAAEMVMEVLDRTADPKLEALLTATPGPWSPELSDRILSRLLAIGPEKFAFRPQFYAVLAERLDPAAAPGLDRLATHLVERDHQRGQVRSVRSALSMRATIRTQFDQLDPVLAVLTAPASPPSPE